MGIRDYLHFLNSIIPFDSFESNPIFSRNFPIKTYEPKQPYYYYETPDYADVHKKVWFGVKYGSIIAITWSYFDILMITRPVSYAAGVALVAKNMRFIAGTVTTAAVMTTVIANLRGRKDDIYNSVLGFASSGLIWGFKFGPGRGLATAIGFGVVGLLFKKHALGHMGRYQLPEDYWDHSKIHNGAMGSRRFHDWVYRSKRIDPGRISLD